MNQHENIGTFCEKCRMPLCICDKNVVYGKNSLHPRFKQFKNISLDFKEKEITWDDIEEEFVKSDDFYTDIQLMMNWLKTNFEPPKRIKK